MFARTARMLTAAARSAAPRSNAVWQCAVRGGLTVGPSRFYTTVGELLDESTAAYPHRDALRAPQHQLRMERRHVEVNVNAFAAGLVEAGYTPGSKLAVWMGNDAEHTVALLAAAKAGIVVVSIDPDVSAADVLDIVAEEGCRGLVFNLRFGKQHRGEELTALLPDLELAERDELVNHKPARALKHLIHTGKEVVPGMIQWSQLPVADPMPNPLPAIAASISADDAFLVPYAAAADGSAQRGAPLTQADLLATAQETAKQLDLGIEDSVVVAAGPHTRFGFGAGVLAALHAGSQVILPPSDNATAMVEAAKVLLPTALVTDGSLASMVTDMGISKVLNASA